MLICFRFLLSNELHSASESSPILGRDDLTLLVQYFTCYEIDNSNHY